MVCHIVIQESEEDAVLPAVTMQIPQVTTTSGVGTSTTAVESTSSLRQNKQLDVVKYSGSTSSPTRLGMTSVADSQRSLTASQKQQIASPFARQDIFYTGSVTTLQEYKQSPNMKTYVQVSIEYSFFLLSVHLSSVVVICSYCFLLLILVFCINK